MGSEKEKEEEVVVFRMGPRKVHLLHFTKPSVESLAGLFGLGVARARA
jgi:hypothetical protein